MWDKEYGVPCIVVSFEGLQTSAVPRADCREAGLSYLLEQCGLDLIMLRGQSRTVQEYVRVGVQSPAYLGFRPADDLSVDCRRMGYFVSDSFGGAFPNPVPATLDIRAS